MNRKLLSVLLALLMVLSLVPTIFAPKAAVADAQPIDQSIVQGGAILHCYNWSYSEIEAHLDEIKAAGYVAVQTSPVQPPKDYSAAWNDTPGNWWKLYQPLDFAIAPDNDGIPSSWLGTKAELTSLCRAADQKGIYVIVDVVANHMANVTEGGYKVGDTYNVSPQVAECLQDPDGSKNLYHTSQDYVDDGDGQDRYKMTQNHMGMPDLNTSNKDVQNMVLDFLKECVDCGVDGFRFDAAKHIELPGDWGCGSDFWPTVLNGIRDYAGAGNLFIYGESLSGKGREMSWVNEFTTYMALTDNSVGNIVRDGIEDVSNLNAGCLANSYYERGENTKDYVIWVESHDTYEEGYYNASNNGGASRGISSDLILRAWAIVGARADSTALYLARPNETMGLASTDISWKSPAVAAVNKFKTYFDGTGEYLYSSGNVAWIERGESGNAGVSIGKLDGAGAVSLTVQKMSNGLYVDEISGNVFVVKDGTITGNVGPTGVAVIYKAAPYITTSPIYLVPGVWSTDNPKFLMYVFNNVDDNIEPTWTVMTDAGGGKYKADLPAGNWNGLIFIRMSSSNNTSFDWNSVWNQTADLAPDPGCDTFTITGWGGDNNPDPGTWSASVSTENPNAGYYLVGTMNGWTINPAYKMTRTSASTEEYTIDVNLLRSGESDPKKFRCSQFKVVYSSDGITKDQWYPDGFGNNYGDDYNYNTKTGEIPVSGYYTVYFRPNGDGGSDWHNNCIYATQSKYYVKIDDRDNNGVVTVNKTIADMDDAITVTVTPHEGYELDTLTYSYETGTTQITTVTNDVEDGSFTMPAFNVTVTATFKEAAVAEPEFKTQSLTLDGSIGVNFYMDLSMLSAEDLADADKTYMTFDISGKGTVSSDPVPVNTAKKNRTATLYGFTCSVNSIQMADTITATFHYGDGQTVTKDYSIMQYYEAFKEHADDYSEETRNLVRTLVCYGYCTQQYLEEAKNLPLGYDEASYAPIVLPGEFAEMVASYDYATIADMIELYSLSFKINNMNDENIKGISFMLALDSETKMTVTFKPDPSYTGIATCEIDNANEADMQKVRGRFVAEVPNIPAHKLGEMHTIVVFTGDNCYTQVSNESTVIEASPMSYVYLMLTRTGATENEKSCGAAIYTYWKAAQAYIGE
ncbi:MAG: hypothetical protein IJI34_09110 [Clostridia bacterium]|nr:hypothetical protein [Clostridia bacterium]